MQLLPYDTFTIQSQEPLSDVIKRLEAHIEAPKAVRWSFSRNHAPYQGTLSNAGFEITRVIHYRNSFLPNIQGRFESLPGGTVIRVTMRLHPFVTGFLFLWYLVWYSGTIPIFLAGGFSGDVPFEAWQFLGLPIVLLLIFWCAFWYEANRSRQELVKIILGESLGATTSGNRRRRIASIGYWIVAIAAIFVWNAWFFFSFVQPGSQPIPSRNCSQDATQSLYCNFSVIYTLQGHPTVSALAISADGKTLVSGGQDKAIKVWDLQTGQLRKTLQSDSGVIQAVAIAPDGKTVVSGSGDRMVRIWNITSDQRPQVLKGHSSDIREVSIASDGKTIISTTYNEIKVWDLATGQLQTTIPNLPPTEFTIGSVSIKSEPPSLYPLAISPDGKTALVDFDSKLVAWDLVTNQQTVVRKANLFFQNITAARISPDGQTGVTISYQQPITSLKVWDLKTGTLKAEGRVSTSRKQRGLSDIALTRDRVIGSTAEGLKVWNLQTAELEATLAREKMRYLVVSSDGKLLAGITGDSYYQNTQIKVLHRS